MQACYLFILHRYDFIFWKLLSYKGKVDVFNLVSQKTHRTKNSREGKSRYSSQLTPEEVSGNISGFNYILTSISTWYPGGKIGLTPHALAGDTCAFYVWQCDRWWAFCFTHKQILSSWTLDSLWIIPNHCDDPLRPTGVWLPSHRGIRTETSSVADTWWGLGKDTTPKSVLSGLWWGPFLC